jgi:NADH-quinone oxidoreductase subunit M
VLGSEGGAVRQPAVAGPGAATDPDAARRRLAPSFPDLSVREVAVLAPLVVLILLLGFYPQPVLDVINPSVQATFGLVGGQGGN